MEKWTNTKVRDSVYEALNFYDSIYFADTETSGLNPKKDRIIELAVIKCDIIGGKIVENSNLHLYIKPPFTLPQKVIDVHGISNEYLSNKPTEPEIFNKIKEFFNDCNIFCAYNADFDLNFIKALYERNNCDFNPKIVIDVLAMAREKVPSEHVENFKQKTIADYFGLSEGIQFHSAYDDTKVCKEIFNIIAPDYISDVINFYSKQKQNLIKPKIYNINYWKKSKEMQRIYIQTSQGKIFYDIWNKCWKGDILSKIDMDYIENSALTITNSNNLKEFARFKGSLVLT